MYKRQKLSLIREVQTDELLTSHDLLRFEEMRQELRELIKFLVDGVEAVSYTHLDVYKRQVIYCSAISC